MRKRGILDGDKGLLHCPHSTVAFQAITSMVRVLHMYVMVGTGDNYGDGNFEK